MSSPTEAAPNSFVAPLPNYPDGYHDPASYYRETLLGHFPDRDRGKFCLVYWDNRPAPIGQTFRHELFDDDQEARRTFMDYLHEASKKSDKIKIRECEGILTRVGFEEQFATRRKIVKRVGRCDSLSESSTSCACAP